MSSYSKVSKLFRTLLSYGSIQLESPIISSDCDSGTAQGTLPIIVRENCNFSAPFQAQIVPRIACLVQNHCQTGDVLRETGGLSESTSRRKSVIWKSREGKNRPLSALISIPSLWFLEHDFSRLTRGNTEVENGQTSP